MIFIIFTHFQNECHKNIVNFVTLSFFVYAINKYNVAFVDFSCFFPVLWLLLLSKCQIRFWL